MTEEMNQNLKETITKLRKFYRNNGLPGYNKELKSCCYYIENPDPTKDQRCAIGALLSLEVAKELKNCGNSISCLLYSLSDLPFSENLTLELSNLENKLTRSELIKLQNCHDSAASKDNFLEYLDYMFGKIFEQGYLEDLTDDSK